MKRIRHDVADFCARHSLVLDTPGDWRVMDSCCAWTHHFFGDISEGITDGVVCWCVCTTGLVAFVHLDLCQSTPLPNLTFGASRLVTASRPTKERKTTAPRRVPDLLASILDGVEY